MEKVEYDESVLFAQIGRLFVSLFHNCQKILVLFEFG